MITPKAVTEPVLWMGSNPQAACDRSSGFEGRYVPEELEFRRELSSRQRSKISMKTCAGVNSGIDRQGREART